MLTAKAYNAALHYAFSCIYLVKIHIRQRCIMSKRSGLLKSIVQVI